MKIEISEENISTILGLPNMPIDTKAVTTEVNEIIASYLDARTDIVVRNAWEKFENDSRKVNIYLN